jgi:hypothetical protein
MVSSQHADPAMTVRPPADVREKAVNLLARRQREMQAFIVACLGAFNADPDGFLEVVLPHWPAPKPLGRPTKKLSPAKASAVSSK